MKSIFVISFALMQSTMSMLGFMVLWSEWPVHFIMIIGAIPWERVLTVKVRRTCEGTDQFPFGKDLVGCDGDLLIDTGEFAQHLDVAVHRLPGVVRRELAILQWSVFIFPQDGLGDLVHSEGDVVGRLDGHDLDMVALTL